MRKGKPSPKRKAPVKAPAKMKRSSQKMKAITGALMQPGGPLSGGVQ